MSVGERTCSLPLEIYKYLELSLCRSRNRALGLRCDGMFALVSQTSRTCHDVATAYEVSTSASILRLSLFLPLFSAGVWGYGQLSLSVSLACSRIQELGIEKDSGYRLSLMGGYLNWSNGNPAVPGVSIGCGTRSAHRGAGRVSLGHPRTGFFSL